MKDLNFSGFSSPIISFTKWVERPTSRTFYDLYINLHYDSRYDSFEALQERISLIEKGLGCVEVLTSDIDFPNS